MTIDATFWVAVSFVIFVGLILYFKIPEKVWSVLDENINNISKFGFHFGIAYQIQDDILDITSSKNKEGKPVFNDLSEGVITLPIILFLESKKYSDDAIKKFSKKEKEGLLKEIINSNAIEKSKETVKLF